MKVQYKLAVKTVMEVFDYLLVNDFFEFNLPQDFLTAKIEINENGFLLISQTYRGVWDDETLTKQEVSSEFVLSTLIDMIDIALASFEIPEIISDKYAYIHDMANKLTGVRKYYSSYGEILNLFILGFNHELRGKSKKVDFSAYKYSNLKDAKNMFRKANKLELRTIECYAKVENLIKKYTKELLLIDDGGYYLDALIDDDIKEEDYFKEMKFLSEEAYVDWDDFKELIINKYVENCYEKCDVQSNIVHGKKYTKNINMSPLGLDGETK